MTNVGNGHSTAAKNTSIFQVYMEHLERYHVLNYKTCIHFERIQITESMLSVHTRIKLDIYAKVDSEKTFKYLEIK